MLLGVTIMKTLTFCNRFYYFYLNLIGTFFTLTVSDKTHITFMFEEFIKNQATVRCAEVLYIHKYWNVE